MPLCFYLIGEFGDIKLKNFITIILFLIFFIISALFFSQNDSIVSLNYFTGKLDWQLNWVMVLCVLVGFLLGLSSTLGSLMRAKVSLRQANRKLSSHEKEIKSLRALPIKDEY